MKSLCCLVVLLVLAAIAGCAAQRKVVSPPPEVSSLPRDLEAAVMGAIDKRQVRGAVLVAGCGDRIEATAVHGLRQAADGTPREAMTEDTLFDLASLTKVVGTATACALLVQDGRVRLDDPVALHLPAWPDPTLTVRHLATHTSGFAAYLQAERIRGLYPDLPPHEAVVQAIAAHRRPYPMGKGATYSCLNYLLLARTLEAAAGRSLEDYLRQRVWGPMGMRDTTWRVRAADRPRCAPTSGDRARGAVHDPLAFYWGTQDHMPGNAGLFSTAGDLARFMRMLACRGLWHDTRIMAAETVDLLFENLAPPESGAARGLGWVIEKNAADIPSTASDGVRTHGGFTGTYLWIDRASGAFLVVLSSRLHPDGAGDVFPLRRAAARRLADAFAAPQGHCGNTR